MGCSIWPMARRVVCLLFLSSLVALALQQGVTVTNFENHGTTTIDSSSPPPPLHDLQQNSGVPQLSLKGRTMGPNNFDIFGDIKRKVPNGPDPIHNRRAGKSGEPPGRQ